MTKEKILKEATKYILTLENTDKDEMYGTARGIASDEIFGFLVYLKILNAEDLDMFTKENSV